MATTLVKPVIDPRITEEFNKRCPFKLTLSNVLVLAHVGSKSHGTYVAPDNPEAIDDVDYMGVVIPPIEYVLGVEAWEGVNFMRDELDCVFYSLKKFVGLLMKNNPNVLGMLWMRQGDYIWTLPEFDILLNGRGYFSSLLAYHSFLGYAHDQLKKMTAFDEKATDEWDKAIARVKSVGWDVSDITNKSASLPMPNYEGYRAYFSSIYPDETILAILKLDIVTIQKMHARHFQGYMGEKRKSLVKKYGYDTKNAAHLIRLMRMCCEFLASGELNMYRKKIDAPQLMAIKQGKWTLERVQEVAKNLFGAADEIKLASHLPPEPDRKMINSLLVTLQWNHYSYVRNA